MARRVNISRNDQTIDSRDVIDKIEELETELNDQINILCDWFGFTYDTPIGVVLDKVKETGKEPADYLEVAEELAILKQLAEEGEAVSSDWKSGVGLVNRDYWEEYCEELVKETGDLPDNLPSYLVIDWLATAENIEEDYRSIWFDGEEFLIRSS